MAQSFASTPDGTALSRTSPNGSSVGTNPPPSFPGGSPSGDGSKTQGSRSGHQRSKASNISEDGSTGNPACRTKGEEGGREHFDESEDIFKPARDDHFFKVSNSLMDEFNSLSGGDASHSQTDGSHGADDGSGADDHIANSRVSAILQTASKGETLAPKSFKLIKKTRSGSGETSEENDDNDAAEADCEGDGGAIRCVETDCEDDGGTIRCGERPDDAAAETSVDSVGGEGVNGLDRQGADEVQNGSCSRRRNSVNGGNHGDEEEHSGAAALSEQSPRDSHCNSSGPASSDQHCSASHDQHTHSSNLTDISNVFLSEGGHT